MKLYNKKLLFADDEKDLRDAMKSLLEDEVAEFYVAKNGEEAYEIYKNKKPDIVLLDITMPLLTGLEVAKKIRKNDHTTRIIIITAHSDVNTLLAATELKLTKYLVKPFTGKELFGALDTSIEEIRNFKITTQKSLQSKNNFEWNFKEQTLFYDHEEIRMTPKEKQILQILFKNIDSVISYETLLIDIWDDYDNYRIDTLKTMIKNIRKKTPEDLISNVYGIGFKILS